MPLTLADAARRARLTCPGGGSVERPGTGAIARARLEGHAPGRFVMHACQATDHPVSGTIEVTLRPERGRVAAFGFAGHLRLHADGGRLCALDLVHAPTPTSPRRHAGTFCDLPGEIFAAPAADARGVAPPGTFGHTRQRWRP